MCIRDRWATIEITNMLTLAPGGYLAPTRCRFSWAAPVSYTHLDVYKRQSLNRRATQAPPNPFRKKESIDGFQNRVDELMKGGMKRYDAFQKATEEGYICLLYTSRCV